MFVHRRSFQKPSAQNEAWPSFKQKEGISRAESTTRAGIQTAPLPFNPLDVPNQKKVENAIAQPDPFS